MIKFIVCENEIPFLQEVSNELNKIMMPLKHDYKIFKFNEYNEKLQNIIEDQSDKKIYILDVEMPPVSGLEIASEIREKDEESIIIFLTQYTNYKDDIFFSRLLALDYINKRNFWRERLSETIEHVLRKLDRKKILSFNFNANSYRIPLETINYIEKVPSLKKCLIHTKDGKVYQVTTNLICLESSLSKAFYKCHKSFIVNVENIKRINYIENKVTFKNNQSEYIISNRCRKGLKEYVENY